jgi:hypothetical protein
MSALEEGSSSTTRQRKPSFRTFTPAVGVDPVMRFLASDAACAFLASTMILAPLRAKALEVSGPMPLDPPERYQNFALNQT